MGGDPVKMVGREAAKPASRGIDGQFACLENVILDSADQVEGLFEYGVRNRRPRGGPVRLPVLNGLVHGLLDRPSGLLGVGST